MNNKQQDSVLYKVYFGKRRGQYNFAYVRATSEKNASDVFKIYNPDKKVLIVEKAEQ